VQVVDGQISDFKPYEAPVAAIAPVATGLESATAGV
jgi:hypothetical protein